MIAVVFTVILLIPRLRRLRRNLRIWTTVRVVLVAIGAWLLWRGSASNPNAPGAAYILPGIVLVLFGLLVRARPVKTPVDTVARELQALVVLNGGRLYGGMGAQPGTHGPRSSIFVSKDFVRVLDGGYGRLLEIPVAEIRQIAIREEPNLAEPHAWSLEIAYGNNGAPPACFRYEGVFAEHLAGVAEKTLRQIWKKSLPVIAS